MSRLTPVWLPVLVGLTVGASGCSRGGEKRLNIGGATFIYPMMSKWSSEYKTAKGVEVNYNSTGSGAGIQQMIEKTYDFGCTDAPMNDQQLANARAKGGDVVHIPLALGAVVVIYNLPGVDRPVRFTGEVIADIYLGNITKWSDKRLQQLQAESVKLPDLDIAVYHRSDGSGTTYLFADYLAKVSPQWKEEVGVGTSLKWPTGVGCKGGEPPFAHVARTPGGIGYTELICALGKKDLKIGAVKNRAGRYIYPGLQGVTAAAAALDREGVAPDLRYSLTDAPGEESYPICGTNWAVVYVNQPLAARTLKDFLGWITHEGQQFCEELQYARLPPELVRRAEASLARIRTGNEK